MVQICQSLLKEPMLEEAIRAGDCLAMLVEYFHGTGRMQEAYTHLQDMESRNIALHPYVDAQILEEVFKAVGAKDGGGGGSKTNKQASGSHSNSSGDRGRDKHQDSNNDGIDSDIEEDMGDSPVPSRSKNGGNNNSNNRTQPSQSNERKAPPVSNRNDSRRGSVNNRRDEEELDEDVDEVGQRKFGHSIVLLPLNFIHIALQ